MASFEEIEKKVSERKAQEGSSLLDEHNRALSRRDQLKKELNAYFVGRKHCIVTDEGLSVLVENMGGEKFKISVNTNETFTVRQLDRPGRMTLSRVANFNNTDISEDEMKAAFMEWYL